MNKKKSNIVSEPAEIVNHFSVSFKHSGKDVKINILANIKKKDFNAVFDNWAARTSEYTAESLVAYINSKSHYGFAASEIKAPPVPSNKN